MAPSFWSALSLPPVWAWLVAAFAASFAVFVAIAIRTAESDDPPEGSE